MLLNVKEIDGQLDEEMYINDRGRGGGRTIVRRYSNCSKPGYDIRICKKNEEMVNIYSSD